MLITGRNLFAFVDPKDPFMLTEVAGEDQPGPILSLLGSRRFDSVFLFHTPHTRDNAATTREAIIRQYPACRVSLQEFPTADPKDYSSLMGRLAREVRRILRTTEGTDSYVCVSSGTAEMRAAWFLLKAIGLLPATMLQVGSPAEPLFGAANVKEVRLDTDWPELRDLVMPREYFGPEAARSGMALRIRQETSPRYSASTVGDVQPEEAPSCAMMMEPAPLLELEEALQELDIFVGSANVRLAAEQAAIAATEDVPVLLQGETGTGKDVFAKLIHRMSSRSDRPMLTVNCAAIPKDLVESYLFGHVKGAFTGATADQKGKFEHADGSTLFLDEIGELPVDSQAKLLKILEDGKVEPFGSHRPRLVDVRIVAATNRNLPEEIAKGRFRQDLYYRLEVVKIQLPPLRERRGEIPHLAVALLKKINNRRKRQRQLSKEALQHLERHDWPGNVRELSNVIERSVLYSHTDVLGPDDLMIERKKPGPDSLAMLPDPAPGFSLDEFLAQARKHLILRALEQSNGNQSSAAALLGLSKQAVSKFLRDQNDNEG